jgi:hypothetical protein
MFHKQSDAGVDDAEPTFTRSEVNAISGVHPANVNGWRHAGLLDCPGLDLPPRRQGRAENSWKFHQLCGLVLLGTFHRAGIHPEKAARFAGIAVQAIDYSRQISPDHLTGFRVVLESRTGRPPRMDFLPYERFPMCAKMERDDPAVIAVEVDYIEIFAQMVRMLRCMRRQEG